MERAFEDFVLPSPKSQCQFFITPSPPVCAAWKFTASGRQPLVTSGLKSNSGALYVVTVFETVDVLDPSRMVRVIIYD